MDSYLIYALNEYLSDTKVVDGAFYIDGPWGSGKSYFIDRYIKIYTEQHKKVNPDFDENKDKLFIKVSLNGVKNIDDVSKEIFAQCHPTISKITNGKIARGILTLGKIFIDKKVGVSGGEVDDIIGSLGSFINSKFSAIILDDFERCRIDCQELFGFINSLISESFVKVILIGNDSEVRRYLQQEELHQQKLIASNISKDFNEYKKNVDEVSEPLFYDVIKEKTIYKTYYFVFDKDLLYTELGKVLSKSDQKILKANYKTINIILAKTKCSNLRTCKVALENYQYIKENIKKKFINNYEIKNQILVSCFYYTVLYKNANIVDDEMDLLLFEPYLNNVVESIKDYVEKGTWNRKKLIEELTYIDNQYNSTPDFIKDLDESFYFMTDDELKTKIKNLIYNIDNVPFDNYYKVIDYIVTYKSWFNDDKIDIDAIIKKLKDNINNFKNPINIRGNYLNHYSNYENEYKIINGCIDKHNEKESTKKLLNLSENIGEYTLEELKEIEREAYAYKSFFSRIDVSMLMKMISTEKNDKIFQIRSFLQNVYRVSNINEFFKSDIPNLELFRKELKTYKHKSIITGKCLELLIHDVDEYLIKLKK